MSLLQLSNAYRALANGGRYSETRILFQPDQQQAAASTSQPASKPALQPAFRQALDARASFIVSHILSDNNARIPTFGSNSVLHTRFWSAVKTGTSKDMRDNWALGYSERYTVGVWVGNAQGQAMWDVSGTTGAAPIWASVMRYLHRSTPSRPPQPPAGLVRTRVEFGSSASSPASAPALKAGIASSNNAEPARMEWFIQGTEQTSFVRSQQKPNPATAHILNPVHGSLLALDPDIPPKRQRLMLRASAGASANSRWLIDDKLVGKGATVPWMPWPGKHRITLQSANGQTLHEVQIEVRGALVKPGHAAGVKRAQR